MRSFAFFAGLVMFGLAVSVPTNAGNGQYPIIQVTPEEVDFGNVLVGSSSTTTITIANVGEDPLLLHSINFKSGNDPNFSFIIMGSMVLEPPNGNLDTTDVKVSFSPVAAGAFSVILVIYNSDTNNKFVEIPLNGVGVAQEISIDDIITFFDKSVEAGTLHGKTGCHHRHKCKCNKAAWMRLRLYRRILVAAKYTLEKGWTNWACFILKRAYKRSDGQPRPRDFVTGEARPDLAGMILTLRDQLGCRY